MSDQVLLSFTTDGGRKVSWAEYGDPDGVPTLFFHGTPGGRLALARQAARLVRQGLLVIAPDRPGYGASDPTPGRSISDFARDTVALMNARGVDRAIAIGGSSGGADALALAAQAPDRVLAVGVMVGAVPLARDELDRLVGINQQVMARVHDPKQLRLLVTEIRRMLLEEGLTTVLADAPEQDRRLFEEDLQERDAAMRSALEQGVDGMVDDYRAIFGMPWGFQPSDVRVPVVWAHGRDDRNVPLSAARRYADQLPRCTFLTWDTVGHAVPPDLQAELHTAVLAACIARADSRWSTPDDSVSP